VAYEEKFGDSPFELIEDLIEHLENYSGVQNKWYTVWKREQEKAILDYYWENFSINGRDHFVTCHAEVQELIEEWEYFVDVEIEKKE